MRKALILLPDETLRASMTMRSVRPGGAGTSPTALPVREGEMVATGEVVGTRRADRPVPPPAQAETMTPDTITAASRFVTLISDGSEAVVAAPICDRRRWGSQT